MTKQDYVNDLQANLPQAVTAIGIDKLNGWANGTIASRERDAEYALYQDGGLTQHLQNLVLCYLDLPSVGYDDFSNEKLNMGNAYRSYVAISQSVYDAAVAQLSVMQTANATADVIAIQEGVISSELQNLNTWKATLATALANGTVV